MSRAVGGFFRVFFRFGIFAGILRETRTEFYGRFATNDPEFCGKFFLHADTNTASGTRGSRDRGLSCTRPDYGQTTLERPGPRPRNADQDRPQVPLSHLYACA